MTRRSRPAMAPAMYFSSGFLGQGSLNPKKSEWPLPPPSLSPLDTVCDGSST
eukprot:CAMPEP_0180527162 /NCGR_PEP_ID=MMETSP1036_2-20121128/60090_1 /TAXON_ID=632150 /ORGANISM="Azadinium spinosum, Strain 3D9" /LENGTH=51 /DNA_ID=CAMNT_0022540581 /DNA_START=365 /DNA_END=517 /DNA_ORIENTATION=+